MEDYLVDDDYEMDIEDDDPIEYECDVYFNSELDDLYLLQFPTKPDPFQLDNFPKHGRLKPDHFQIELDLDLNTRGAYYDMDKAAELKMGLDSESHNDIVDKIKYNSFKVPMNSRYLIGIKNEDGLHLTQLKNIIQMRPYLDYIDQKAEKEKELKNSNDKEEDAKAIQMSFELEDLESTRKASAAKLRRAMEDEPWIPLQVHLPNSDLSEQMKNSLTFMDLEDNSNALDQTPAQYLDKICSMGVQMRDSKEVEKKPKLDKFMSFSETNTLEPVERLKGLFINANVIYYPQIKSRFPELDDEQLLKQLSNVAVCIRGLWISQSHLLYMDRPFDARQYLLGMFLHSETISRKMFADVVRLPYDMVQNLLLEIAVLDQETRTWSLKLPSDEEFMESFPEVIQEQTELIQANAKLALDSFSSKQKTTVVQKQIPHRQSAPKTQPSTESKMIYPLTGKDSSSQAQNLIKEIFKTRGVVSRDEIHSIFEAQQKRNDKASKIQTVTSEEIDRIIDGLSIPFINDYLVLKSSGNDLLDAFRITTMKYFMEKTKVKKAEMMTLWQNEVGKVPNATMYSKVMSEFASTRSGGNWTLKGFD